MTVAALSPCPPARPPQGPSEASRGGHPVGPMPPASRWALAAHDARPAPTPPPSAAAPCPIGVAQLDGLLGQCRRQARLASVLLVEVLPTHPETTALLMCAIGQRLRQGLRAGDAMTPLGDAGLAVLLFDVGERRSFGVRNRLEHLLREPYPLGAGWARPLLRIGRAVYGLDGQHAADLLRAAALAPR